jgi:hypothetical protein
MTNMWLLTKLAFAAGMTALLFQNSPPAPGQQNSASSKTAPNSPAKPKDAAGGSSTAGSTQPVITVHGACGQGSGKAATSADSCTTVINREQFEALVQALNPGSQTLPANARKNLAKTYAEYVAIEAAARKAGMEDTPQFRELMNWTRLRTITDLYRRSVQEKYSTPSQAEIDGYYQQHLAEYERVKLARVLIPRESPSAANKDDFDKKAHEAANAARESLIKGVDPVQVQKDAYATLGLAAPPATELGNRRRADLLADESVEVFALKIGEVSKVQTEPRNYVVYKVTGKDVLPKEQVKNDISREIYRQKFQDAMKSVLDAAPAEYDEQYLEPGTPAKAAATTH